MRVCLSMRFLPFVLSIFAMGMLHAQTPVGSWRSHLPMGVFDWVDELDQKLYAVNAYGVMVYDREEESKQSLTKINALSQTGISAFACSEEHELCIVGYDNGNLDILDAANNVTNQPAILTSNIVGDKAIRSVIFKDDLALLVTGIGLIQLDLSNYNILEYSRLGFEGDDANLQKAASINDSLFFTTPNGVYALPLDEAFTVPEPTAFSFDGALEQVEQIFQWNGHAYLLHRNEIDGSDTLYQRVGTSFQTVSWLAGEELRWFDTKDDMLLVTGRVDIRLFNTSEELVGQITQFWAEPGMDARRAQFTDEADEIIVADGVHGGVIARFGDQENSLLINISSPRSGQIGVVEEEDGIIYAMPGGNDFTFNIPYLFQLKDQEWTTDILFTDEDQSIRNPVDIAAYENRKYVAFDGHGYIVMNRNNEILEHVDFPETRMNDDQEDYYGLRDIEVDAEGNLWMLNNRSLSTLSVLDAEDNWSNFSAEGFPQPSVTDLLLHSSGMLVFAMKDQGMMVYDPGDDVLSSQDDRWVNITSSPASGSLNNNTVNCFLEDKDGELWIGTDEGIGVIYNMEQVFEPNFSVQKIIVRQDGFNGYLFESDAVISMEVDGADRKWVAPRGAGLFLISSDGQEQLLHFTEDDSPLLNNNISDLAMDPVSGELFIATERGLLSYRSNANEPAESLNAIKVFPNPVKPGYGGLITFTGLTDDSYVRITDASGALVYETTSQGGTATWDGNNQQGQRVPSGVYLVFGASRDGVGGSVSKVLFLD